MTLPEPAKKMGAPPHWMSHVQVADVDATVALARKHDGRVFVEPTDIPTIGRFAVLADPQGASLSVFKPETDMAVHDTTKPGEFCWSELVTTAHEAAFTFYSTLFGWDRIREHDMGPMGKYLLYGKGDKAFGGMFTKSKDMPAPTAWLYYIQVADIDAAVARVKEQGGKILNGPMEVPGGARIAQLSDPQGAVIALHEEPKSRARGPCPSNVEARFVGRRQAADQRSRPAVFAA